MRAYVINLDRCPQRWTWMTGQAESARITIERIPAIDRNTLTSEQTARWKGPPLPKHKLTSGEIACYLSHRKAWEAIASGEDDYGTIFEDDVHLGPGLANLLNDTRWIPAGADIVRLETFGWPVTYLTNPSACIEHRSLHEMYGTHLGCAGYILSRQSARFLLTTVQAISMPIDVLLSHRKSALARKLRRYQLVPAPVVQDKILNGENENPVLESCLEDERIEEILDHQRQLGIDRPVHSTHSASRSPWKKMEIGFANLIRKPRGLVKKPIPFG